MTQDDIVSRLQQSYDRAAATRETYDKESWKVVERAAFLGKLQAEGHKRLLEIGAGTGKDSAFFQASGLSVTATDLSPEMVELCRAKGLHAHVMDFWNLDLAPATFDAVFALNCLLHVPNAKLPEVLEGVRRAMRPGGLFFLGVYGGGEPFEGVAADDYEQPPRFFSFRTDDQLRDLVSASFAIEDFHTLDLTRDRFQSVTLRA